MDEKASQRQLGLRYQAAFLWSGATQDFVKVCVSASHISDPKLSPISPPSGPSSFSVLLMTTVQALMLTVGPAEAPYEQRDRRDDGAAPGEASWKMF